MLASEMIERLQQLMDEHGDLPVLLYDWNEGYAPPLEASSVDYEDDAFCIDAE